MADKWNSGEPDVDEQAIGTEEVRGVAADDDEEFEDADELDDEEDEEGGPAF